MKYTFEYYKKAAEYILEKTGGKVEIGLVLGSALGGIADQITDKTIIKYKEIPNFLISTVDSHAGELIIGNISGKRVVCMSGRFHYYEGYDFERLAIPMRVFKLLGVDKVILTNAAGGINTEYKPGDVMMIKDHIKLMGPSPVRGPNIPELGPRFFDVSDMYSTSLRELAKIAAQEEGIDLKEGVYFFATGPQFETPAEIRAMRILGGDAVGMSTVTEAITAAHCGIKILGFSLISNMAAGVYDQPVTTEEVNIEGAKAKDKMMRLIASVIKSM